MLIVGILLFLSGVMVLLPIFFERDVRQSRYLSLCFRLKFLQHLCPTDNERQTRAFSKWLAQKDRWNRLSPQGIGRRVRTVRELTGARHTNHVLALELAGGMIQEIAARGWIKPGKSYATATLPVDKLLVLILSGLRPEVPVPNEDEAERDVKIRLLLKENPIEIEQIAEILLAAVELLQHQIELRE